LTKVSMVVAVVFVFVCVAIHVSLVHGERFPVSTADAPSDQNASQGMVIVPGGFFYTSIQYGIDVKTGRLVDGGPANQTSQAMTNMAAVFSAAGLVLAKNATACVLYIANMDTDFDVISSTYKTFFPITPHPTRSPPGVGLAIPDALVGIQCEGAYGTRNPIAPPNFFVSDFNSQGMVASGSVLATAGQVGADPVSGNLVPGGAYNETIQALANLQVVFAAAFPEVGPSAILELAADCQVMIAEPRSNWALVQSALETFFSDDDDDDDDDVDVDVDGPAVTYSGIDVGDGASVEIACTGSAPSVKRTVMSMPPAPGAQGVLLQFQVSKLNGWIILESQAQLGLDPVRHRLVDGGIVAQTNQALANTQALFKEAFPHFRAALGETAVRCSLLVSDPANVAIVESIYGNFFSGYDPRPTKIVTIVDLPGAALVAIQCYGSTSSQGILSNN